MTAQTKHYIELSDILALRCVCKACETSLVMAFDSNMADSLKKCPKCRKGWTTLENTSRDEDIDAFVNAAIRLRDSLDAMGFDLSLEIKSQS
jgi:hypothetical protein